MTNAFHITIYLPILLGLLLCLLPERTNQTIKGIITLLVSLTALGYGIIMLRADPGIYNLTIFPFASDQVNQYFQIQLDGLSRILVFFTAIFAAFITLYSLVYQKKHRDLKHYYACVLVTLGCTIGALLANHLILLLFFWGILGITLYKLVNGNEEGRASVAKKTLILIGGSDSLMIIGIGLLWLRTNNLFISEINLAANTLTASTAFMCLLVGCFTKAGAFPFHTWMPDYTGEAPATSSAYLPASLDKILGIYLLARLCMDMFVLTQGLMVTMIVLGASSILVGGMMALTQADYKRMLGYSAVSQVGYMIVGLGLCTPIGIAGAIFHLINHSLYDSGLFLSAGSLEYRTGKSRINSLGGLSRVLPITFVCTMVFGLAISGIPPLNGFASKWIIYQSLIDAGGSGTGISNGLWIIILAIAVFGSALTLAVYLKFIAGAFLGRIRPEFESLKEVPALMWIPAMLLVVACIAFGLFIQNLVMPHIIYPITGAFKFIGVWQSGLVAILIVVSVLIGLLIYLLSNIQKFRTEESFIGGEMMQDSATYDVEGFYKTFSNFKLLAFFYRNAEKKRFDIYDQSKHVVLGFNSILSRAQNGLLTSYAFWIIAGMLFIMLLLF